MPSPRVTRSPTSDATSAGTSAPYSIRPSTTNSRPKTAPAMGVPKTDPKPPATPAASSCRRSGAASRRRCESQSVRLAPICTAVPSRPALPPKRCVSTVPPRTSGAMRKGISGPSSWMVSMTRLFPALTAWP